MSNVKTYQSTVNYVNAPIVEAILEVSIHRTAPIQLSELASVVEDDNAYPQRVDLIIASGQMTVGPKVSASATSQQIGYQFISADQTMIIHCKQDGLAISRLKPYTDWNNVFGEFRRIWERYVSVIKPEIIRQTAVRYVNRFDLPGTKVELSDYFRTYPQVSEDIKADICGFLIQLQIPQPDIQGLAVITQAGVPPASPGVISILLDIVVSLPLDKPATIDALEGPLETLHRRKNELFEACMKPAVRDLIRETPS